MLQVIVPIPKHRTRHPAFELYARVSGQNEKLEIHLIVTGQLFELIDLVALFVGRPAAILKVSFKNLVGHDSSLCLV